MPRELSWTHKTPKHPAFILGSGPSVLDEPLELLDRTGSHVYVVNQSWKALEMGLINKCNGLAVTGLVMWEAMLPAMLEYGLNNVTKFYSDLIVNSRPFKDKAPNYDKYYMFKKRRFMDDETKDLKNGWMPTNFNDRPELGKTGSITLDMAVLCYLIGYKKIYLLGTDLDYTSTQNYFMEGTRHNYKVSGPTVNSGLRTGIHKRMIILAGLLEKQGVELVNISRGYKPKLYNNSMPMPVDRLENILDGVVKPKAIGCIVKSPDPLTPKDIDQITYVRSKCDKLIISCINSDMQHVMSALRFVDGAIISENEQHALEQLRQKYPKDSIRLFKGKEYKQYNAE